MVNNPTEPVPDKSGKMQQPSDNIGDRQEDWMGQTSQIMWKLRSNLPTTYEPPPKTLDTDNEKITLKNGVYPSIFL